MKKETIQLEKQNLINTYNESCSDVKSALKKLYPDVEFEKKLAESWEEYCKIANRPNEGKFKILLDFDNFCLDINEKYTALYKLELLRDHYNGDWKPCTDADKYVIIKKHNKLYADHFDNYDAFLSFKTTQLRDKFLTNFKDLIEQAGDLI
jgi:hypothetical protein